MECEDLGVISKHPETTSSTSFTKPTVYPSTSSLKVLTADSTQNFFRLILSHPLTQSSTSSDSILSLDSIPLSVRSSPSFPLSQIPSLLSLDSIPLSVRSPPFQVLRFHQFSPWAPFTSILRLNFLAFSFHPLHS